MPVDGRDPHNLTIEILKKRPHPSTVNFTFKTVRATY